MSKYDEQILVVPRAHLFGPSDEFSFEGVRDAGTLSRALEAIAEAGRLIRRGDVEEDSSYQQPIPYVLVMREIAEGETQVYTYERLSGGGEARLHSRLSVGVGGHVNALPFLTDPALVLREEAEREIDEELCVQGRGENEIIEIIGLLNTDRTDVDSVHVGIVCVLRLSASAEVDVREHDTLRGFWSTPSELLSEGMRDRLENWSALALEFLRDR